MATDLNQGFISLLENEWVRNREKILLLAVAIMGSLALLKLGTEFYRLLFDPGRSGAVDLHLRWRETQDWFRAIEVYGPASPDSYGNEASRLANYPPATYILLWPVMGWLSFEATRWVWAAITILALAFLTRFFLANSGATTSLEKTFVVLLPLSMNALGVCVGSGQFVALILPMMLSAVLMLSQEARRFRTDFLIAALLTATLIQPSISIPFMWLIPAVFMRFRVVAITVILYGGLTAAASVFQDQGPWYLLFLWLTRNSGWLGMTGGYGNIHSWLYQLDMQQWALAGSATIFAVLGIWLYRNRKIDMWILLAVVAIVARIWFYHRQYDDLLIAIPMLALFRLAKLERVRSRLGLFAGGLLATTILAMMIPARFIAAQDGVGAVARGIHVAVFLTLLCFFVYEAYRRNKARQPTRKQVTLAAKR